MRYSPQKSHNNHLNQSLLLLTRYPDTVVKLSACRVGDLGFEHHSSLQPSGPSLYVRIWRIKTVLALKGLKGSDARTFPLHSLINLLTAKLFNLNFHSLEVVSRWRDPQFQVSENYTDLTKWRLTKSKSCWLMSHFLFKMFKWLYIMW